MTEIADFAPETVEFYQRGADAAFKRLRAEDPLHWYEPCRFWAVTKYADVQEISQHPRRFSSQKTQLFELVRMARGETALEGAMTKMAEPPPTTIQLNRPQPNGHPNRVRNASPPPRTALFDPA